MSDPFVAEIRIFGFNFPPKGWAFCDGQLLPLSQNTALFSLLGTQYGGDGKTTFALPNLQGNAAMHTDQYSGGGQYPIGTDSGEQTVTLLQSEMPAHNHNVQADIDPADLATPGPNVAYTRCSPGKAYNPTLAPSTTFSPLAIGVAGSSFPHNNMMPYLTLNFCIALQGVFPPRS
jgi:microcystin-dependent protein